MRFCEISFAIAVMRLHLNIASRLCVPGCYKLNTFLLYSFYTYLFRSNFPAFFDDKNINGSIHIDA